MKLACTHTHTSFLCLYEREAEEDHARNRLSVLRVLLHYMSFNIKRKYVWWHLMENFTLEWSAQLLMSWLYYPLLAAVAGCSVCWHCDSQEVEWSGARRTLPLGSALPLAGCVASLTLNFFFCTVGLRDLLRRVVLNMRENGAHHQFQVLKCIITLDFTCICYRNGHTL